jgi:DNA polymerase-3 subunit epsilon
MSELSESVIVCNTAGRILLYNQRVQQLLGSAATSGTGRDTPDLIGLGRSLFTVVDRNVVAHALDHIQHRLQEGDRQPVAVFITATRGGQSIRARMAPVLVAAATDGGAPAISGFVLMLEDVKRDLEIGILRDRFLTALTEGTRSSLANIRAAVENIAGYPQMEPAQRQQFLQIMSGEAEKLSSQLDSAENAYADDLKSEWPLATMLGHDLLSALRRTIESRLGLAVTLSGGGHSLWLKVDSFLLVEACAHLAGRLRDERGVRAVVLRLDAVGQRPQLDMQWHGAALAIETALAWENEPLNVGGQQHAPTFKSIVERHGGEAWYKFDTASQTAYFRVLLRPAEPDGTTAHAVSRAPSRPIFYDFDLFHQPGLSPELDERLLIELAYTVFDTETSGLEPSAGDEIVSIGAVRIVNARVLVDEVFDQLVDPRRPLSMASVNIHGITSDMLQGQPTIEEVLPAFHRFCEDTVLVAHNAAFDMRFLQMKESAAGVRFTQPVLAAVVHPNQDDNTLEAIAGRLGVNIIGRHTAPGDAIVTAEIFLKLLPLLAAQGIKTLHDARQASQQTPYARLHY